MTPVVSTRLTFTRDGRRLLALDRDALAIVELSTGVTSRIAVDDARAAVGFVDQIWVVQGHDTRLVRFKQDGTPVDTHQLVGDGTLTAAPIGTPAALWGGEMLFDDGGGLHVLAVPKAELVVPLTARRWVTVTGPRVVTPSGLACELAPGSRVLGGHVLFDGTAIGLLVERSNTREIVVVGLANGRVQQRLTIRAGMPRIAARRGLVGLLAGPRDLAILDLRSGRTLGELRVPFAPSDYALDPDGEQLAVRDGEAAIELVGLREALAPKPQVVVEESIEPVEEVTAEAEPPAAAPAPPRERFARPLDLRALAPLDATPPVVRDQALELLDSELRGIALWTLRAIAEAWDTRRLGYGNEGNHPFEHEVAALLGMNRGFARSYVEAADEHLLAYAAAMQDVDTRGAATPLGALAREHGLSELAVDILLVVAAPSLWSEAARLYGILANDPARPLVDEALVEQILACRGSRHAIAGELSPRAPLVRLGVIATSHTRPFSALAVDPVVLARLRSELPDLGLGVTARGSTRALEELVVAPGVLDEAIAGLARVTPPARIVVRGRPGSGRRTLLAALAAEANRALGVIDVSLLPRRALGHAMRRVQLAGLVPCIVGLELAAHDERDDRDATVEVLRAHPGPLALVLPADHNAPLDPGHVSIDLPAIDEGERLGVWRDALADAGLVADPARLAARYRLGPGAIHRAIAATRERVVGTAADTAIDQYIRQTRDARLGQHARRVERLATWDRLVLPADIIDSLRELVSRQRHRRKVFEAWGMDRVMSTSRGLTALFSGPPGTGKTLVAGVIARELGLDLYQIDLSKLMSKWIGETERNLATIFDAADDGQVIRGIL